MLQESSINTFYYNVRRLRIHACKVPASAEKHITPVQDVVPIKIVDDDKDRIYTKAETTAISINCNGLEINISNNASEDIIKAVIGAVKV